MNFSRKVHKLNKVLLWNVTKCGLCFNITPLPPTTSLSAHFFNLCCSAWISLVKKLSTADMIIIIWTFQLTWGIRENNIRHVYSSINTWHQTDIWFLLIICLLYRATNSWRNSVRFLLLACKNLARLKCFYP